MLQTLLALQIRFTVGSTLVVLNHRGLVLDLGFLLLSLILFWYARVLGRLLALLQKPPLEVFVRAAGWILIVTFVLPHYLAVSVFYPNLQRDPAWFPRLWWARTFSFYGMLVAAILVLVPSFLYWYWTRE